MAKVAEKMIGLKVLQVIDVACLDDDDIEVLVDQNKDACENECNKLKGIDDVLYISCGAWAKSCKACSCP